MSDVASYIDQTFAICMIEETPDHMTCLVVLKVYVVYVAVTSYEAHTYLKTSLITFDHARTVTYIYIYIVTIWFATRRTQSSKPVCVQKQLQLQRFRLRSAFLFRSPGWNPRTPINGARSSLR